MATLKQQKVARRLLDNLTGRLDETAQRMLENVGYGQGVAKYPGRVLQSKGVQEELKKLGFNIEDAKKAVTVVLNKGDYKERIMAAREIFKVMGGYAPEKIEHSIDKKIEEFIDRIAERHK